MFTMLMLVCVCSLVCGCAGDTSVETGANDPDSARPEAATGPDITSSITAGLPGGAGTAEPSTEPQSPAPNTGQPDAGGERVRAEVGVAKQGQATKDIKGGIGGMIVQPARSLFAVKQRAVFEIKIPHAMNLFSATEGRKPKSNEEFMAKIIKANNIKLPELPAGQTYVYDPELGELMVRKPGG